MDNTTYYVTWGITQLLACAAACLFFGLDQKNKKQQRKQGQDTIWYRRGFFVVGWIFLVPLLGIGVPEMIISLVVFHGSVRPSSPDFSYQLFTHSLSFFTWLAICSYGIEIVLVAYMIYLGIRVNISQHKR